MKKTEFGKQCVAHFGRHRLCGGAFGQVLLTRAILRRIFQLQGREMNVPANEAGQGERRQISE
jgi:hypothetical protein